MFAASLLGRLPIGVTGLAILLLVQTSSGSFALGGAAAGCYVSGLAVVAPMLGRLIESVLIEIIFIVGPLIVALLVAFATPSSPSSGHWPTGGS
jgi:hypothetical protein